MAVLVKVWFLFMLSMNAHLYHLHEPVYVFGTKGLPVTLQMFCKNVVDTIDFYRSDQQYKPPFLSETTSRETRKYNVRYFSVEISENQEFVSECWKQGTLLERRHFHVIVCAEKSAEEKMSLNHGVPADIVCQTFNFNHGETLQVFKNILHESYIKSSTIILDTNMSLEIIPDELRRRVVNKGSLIHFSDVSSVDSGVYSCLVWSDNQCQNYKDISLHVENKDIFLEPKQSVTLPCLAKDLKEKSLLAWWSPITIYLPGLNDKSDQSVMLNETQTGNYSLVIPHLMPNHTGTYTCTTDQIYNELNIFVCSDLEPKNMVFSLGDAVNLSCHPYLTDTLRVQWYREYNQSSKHLLVDSHNGFVNEKMKNRLNAFNPQNYISISELSITDGGLYWCRIWGINLPRRGLCFKRRIHLTYAAHEDTFYLVYALLMGVVLLGMIITVACVTVWSRKRRQTTGI